MKKEDILARSRAEGKDEMECMVNNEAFYWGAMTLILACIFFAATKIANNGEPFFEFPAIIFANLVGMNLYNFIKLKDNKYLVGVFGFLFAFICMTILYFINR